MANSLNLNDSSVAVGTPLESPTTITTNSSSSTAQSDDEENEIETTLTIADDDITMEVDDNSNSQEELNGIATTNTIPASPPPSYEFVLEEKRLKQKDGDKQQSNPQSPSSTTPVAAAPVEIMHTSSKEFYKAVAKQFGITCKMSDQCRCYDCQSHYFDCEYEKNEQEKTDGGLGAGTPVFLQEVMHGTACVIL